jgi:hypothetical protein
MDLGSEPGDGLVVTPDSIHERIRREAGGATRSTTNQICHDFNAKAAHALGLTIRPSILLRADEIIE